MQPTPSNMFLSRYIYILLLSSSVMSCTAARIIAYNFPSVDDSEIFDKHLFDPSDSGRVLHYSLSDDRALDSLLKKGSTYAFLIMRGDTVCYAYGEIRSLHPIFSITKSYVSLLVAQAVLSGEIESEYDMVCDYLPEFAGRLDGVRIVDLLNMRSGLKENRWQTMRLYYSSDLCRTVGGVRAGADKSFCYSNYSTQILCMLIERATGSSVTEYFDRNLLPLLHTCEPMGWSIDSSANDFVRGFGGMEVSATDLALLGMTYRDGGVCAGERAVTYEWIDKTLNPAAMTVDKDGACYNYHWYVLKPDSEFFAKGLFGQYLYVDKPSGTIIVRMGRSEDRRDWVALFRSLI